MLAAIPLRFAALIRPSGTPDQVRGRLFSRERARAKGKCLRQLSHAWSGYGYLTTTDVKSRFQSAVAEAFAKICTVCSPAIGTVTTD